MHRGGKKRGIKMRGGIKKKKWENFQDEQDLQHSCEMEEEKCGFYVEEGWRWWSGTPQILFEGHVMPSRRRGRRACQRVGTRSG